MKKMKKLLAGLMAATMVMSMSVTAFADVTAKDENNQDITISKTMDENQAKITKYYKLAETSNVAAISPAETFNFTISKIDVENAAVGITKDNMPVPKIDASVSYVKGDAGKSTNDAYKKDINIYFNDDNNESIYKGVGVYKYIIEETAGDTTGVTYYANDIRLTVTVVQDTDGLIRVAAVHTEEETGKDDEESTYKLGEFSNTYSAGNLSINKTVTGNMGDQNKYFKVTVNLNAPENTKVKSDIAISASSYSEDGNTNPTAITGNNWTETTVVLYIKHGETITLSNIPEGVSYTVVEDDYTETDGYDDATYSVDSSAATTESISDGIKVGDDDGSIDDEVVITNNKGVMVDTGISLDNMPYIMVLAMVALGLVGFVSKKRSMEF